MQSLLYYKAKDAYDKYPYSVEEYSSKEAYYRYLSEALDTPKATVNGWFEKSKFWHTVVGDGLTITRQELDKEGNVKKSILSKRSAHDPVDVSGMVVTRVSTNPWSDKQHVRYERQDITLEEVSKAFDDVVEKRLSGITPTRHVVHKKKTDLLCKVTISDAHVGMAVNSDGLFNYDYDATEFKRSMMTVRSHISAFKNIYGHFDKIIIQDLGDQQDGWNKMTERGGHTLEQNMTNSEMFEICLDEMVSLMEYCVPLCPEIEYQSVTNSNHSASFSEVIGIAVKKIINRLYEKDIADVDLLTKFIEIREWGDHCFLPTHGKDAQYMKRGLPYNLNDRAINWIGDFIDHHSIDHKHVHLEKGDLHMVGFDGSQVKFDYRNFGSFAPPSNWIQHNFGNSSSSFAIQVIEKGGLLNHIDVPLNYRKLT